MRQPPTQKNLHWENLCLIWMEGKGGEVKESRVEFAKNKLILELIYFTLLPIPPPQSKWTIK